MPEEDSVFSNQPICPKCGMKLIEVDEGTFEREHQELVYTCSMHPQIIRKAWCLFVDFGQKK
jgi:hypothetical protein